MPYHFPTLPLPLIKHKSMLKKRKLAPNLGLNVDGNCQVQGLPQEVLNAIVEEQSHWRAKWFQQIPVNKAHYANAPLALQCNPTYCPIRLCRSRELHSIWAYLHRDLLNYPFINSPLPR